MMAPSAYGMLPRSNIHCNRPVCSTDWKGMLRKAWDHPVIQVSHQFPGVSVANI
uniref:Alternative protein HERC1 n=1 Tax=Homo sapiens TaxID=9606 RepID=L8E7Y5_HUMAN|nr:alternative protein HERC1 [Homo sapiens]